MRPLRVAFSTLAPFISGAERSLQVTLVALQDTDIEPIVLGPAGTEMAAWCMRAGIDFVPVRFAARDKWHALAWWSCVRHLRRVLAERQVDVVHANQLWSYQALAAAAARLRMPRVCHLRDETSPEALRWWCATRPDLIIAISQHIAAQVGDAWRDRDRPQVLTMINPVQLPPRLDDDEDARQRLAARAAFGVPADAVVFGFIGQIRQVKGLLDLLEALAGLPAQTDWRLLVAGRDPTPGADYERQCRTRAAAADLAGRVVFTGFVDDVAAFYQAIDVAVVPSREEPLGRVPLEAAAHARPTVACAVGGLPEVVQHGQTGWLVPSGDVRALRAELAVTATGERPSLGKAAREWVEATANPVAYARRLSGVYHGLSAASRRW